MISRLIPNRTTFLLCDIQEKLIPTIKEGNKIINVASRMLQLADALDIPVIVSEQYPAGLGRTVHDLKILDNKNCKIFEKTQFSMFCNEISNHLMKSKSKLNQDQDQVPDSVVIFGLETHVCVLQTVKDFLNNGMKVTLVSDGIASRFQEDRKVALDQIGRWENATISTSESIIFELLKDSNHLKFKEMSNLIKKRSE